MESLFWLDPGRLAGRPGPNAEPWDLGRLRAGGIGAVLSVNDGQDCVAAEFDAAGIDHIRAIVRVRGVRPIALSAEGWESLAERVLGCVQRQST